MKIQKIEQADGNIAIYTDTGKPMSDETLLCTVYNEDIFRQVFVER